MKQGDLGNARVSGGQVDGLWEIALADAGDVQDVELRLFAGTAPSGAPLASLFPKGHIIKPNDPAFPATVGELGDLNGDLRHRHRVGLFLGYPEEEILGRMRHELEHVRQFETHGDGLFDFYEFIAHALGRVWVPTGGGFIYNAIPMEVDANAAASVVLSSNFPDEVVEEIRSSETGASLVRRSKGPQPLETLTIRMLAFAVTQLDACHAAAREESCESFGALCRSEYSGLFSERELEVLGV